MRSHKSYWTKSEIQIHNKQNHCLNIWQKIVNNCQILGMISERIRNLQQNLSVNLEIMQNSICQNLGEITLNFHHQCVILNFKNLYWDRSLMLNVNFWNWKYKIDWQKNLILRTSTHAHKRISLSLSLSHTHTHTYVHTAISLLHTHSLSHTYTLSYTHSCTQLCLSHTQIHTHVHNSLSHTQIHIHAHRLFLSHKLFYGQGWKEQVSTAV